MIKRILPAILLIILTFAASGYKKPHTYTIEPEKNAYFHNNLGLNYMQDKYYYAAIQEFKIAISLEPDTQASSLYYKNLGDVYMIIGYPNLAEDCYLNALKLYGLNLQFYIDLAECYKRMGVMNSRMKALDINSNPFNKVLKGILLIESGNKRDGVIMLDEFCSAEPDLIITGGIKNYLKNINK